MLLTTLSAVVAAAIEGEAAYSPPASTVNGAESSVDQAVAAPNRSLPDGPEYLRQHQTTSYYTKSKSIVESVADVLPKVIFEETGDAYIYTNMFGVYSFSKNDLSALSLCDHSGTLLAFSQFCVESDHLLNLDKAQLVDINGALLVTSQSMVYDGLSVGAFFVKTEFFNATEPKISAWLDSTCPAGDLSFSITWNIVLSDSNVRTLNQTVDASTLSVLDLAKSAPLSFEAGSVDKSSAWKTSCKVDWSDAGCGSLSFGSQKGTVSARIAFPEGMPFIDPTIVGNSSVDYATPGAPFRNVVYFDSTYWLFYYDGFSVVCSNSVDGGLTWSSPTALPGNSTNGLVPSRGAFDVAIEGNHVAVVCIVPFNATQSCIVFTEGYIEGRAVKWNPTISVSRINATSIGSCCWQGGVALCPNGEALVAFSDIGSVPGIESPFIHLHLSKKTKAGAFFVPIPGIDTRYGVWPLPSTPLEPSIAVQPMIIALSDGSVNLMAFVEYCEPPSQPWYELFWNRYYPELDVWENPTRWETPLDLDAAASLSAAPGKSADTHLVVVTQGGFLHYWHLNRDSGNTADCLNLSEQGSCPSISVNPNHDPQIQFIRMARVFEMHTYPGTMSWSSAQQIVNDTSSPVLLSSGEKLLERNYVSYTDWASMPRKVMFAAVPLLADVIGPYGDPWNGAGVNQDQPFGIGIQDVISPGNGLLYLFQTDFVVPGRGMDMVVSRFFATPQYFVKDQSGIYQPYLYDKFPYCNMGEGWQLNLPWIADGYVHLWGGTRIAIEWDGNVFNCSKGQPFVLMKKSFGSSTCYWLDLQDGIRVNFTADGKPKEIYANRELDTKNPNIALEYNASNLLSTMRDYLWRTVYFNSSQGSGGKVTTIEYLGSRVSLAYDNLKCLLMNTTDPLGRKTVFTYATAGNPSLLIQQVTYPTGGRCKYQYDSIAVGSEAIAMVVSVKDDFPFDALNIGHSGWYTYTAVDGVVKYTQVDDCTGMPRPMYMGSTRYNFDSKAKNTVVTCYKVLNNIWNPIPLKRTVSWYSPDGRISRTESYDDFRSPPDVATAVSDSRGNVIYSKDPTGHEVFSSYANTSTRNAFLRPGVLDLASSGKVFSDDFNDWAWDGWTSSGNTPWIDNLVPDPNLGPSCQIYGSGTTSCVAVNLDPTGQGMSDVIYDILVMVDSNGTDARLILSNGLDDNISCVRFARYAPEDINCIQYFGDDGTWHKVGGVLFVSYLPNTLYRVTVEAHRIGVHPTGYVFYLYVDGALKGGWRTEKTDLLKYFRIEVERQGFETYAVIDNVKIFKDWYVIVTNLDPGQFVEMYDSLGVVVGREKADSDHQVTFTLSAASSFIPYASFVVRNRTGSAELVDAYREVWGGDSYSYSKPAFIKNAVTRSSSGFDSPLTTILDDSIQLTPNVTSSNFKFETNPDLVLSETKYHHDGVASGESLHYFNVAATQYSPQQPSVGGSHFFVQFVYLPADAYPSEVGLRYYYQYKVGTEWYIGWSDMAYWGVDAIHHDWINRRMGDLPAPNQWAMLVVRAGDIDWGYDTQVLGIQFWHFGGDVYFDKSACTRNVSFGRLTVDGLSNAQYVELKKADGTHIDSNGVPVGQTSVTFDLYARRIRSYPMSAYFVINDTGSTMKYESPVFKEMYCHDSYWYDRTSSPFYSGTSAPTGFGKLVLGTMQYVDLAMTKSMESYIKYGVYEGGKWVKRCLVNESKSRNGSAWLTTSYKYDVYGNVVKVTDPTGATINYSYWNLGTYLFKVWTKVGSQNFSKIFMYYLYPRSHLLNWETDSRGNKTTYEYDLVGRVVKVTYPTVGGKSVSVRTSYDDTNMIETSYDANGTAAKTYYDAYARVKKVERLRADGSVYSARTYSYDWNGKVSFIDDLGGRWIGLEYDYLGRVTKTRNCDNTYTTTVYDDRNNTVTTYDEMGIRKDAVYDADDRLIQSVQYLGSSKLYTNMTYDGIGNLLTVTDCKGLTTTNEYDDMGRLTRTVSPYGGVQRFWYDNASRLHWKLTESGSNITYSYDLAGRLVEWKNIATGQYTKYTYDWNSNLLVAEHKQDASTVIMTKRDYDSWNRVLNETTTGLDSTYVVKYGYDNRSNVISTEILRAGASVYKLANVYDEFDRLTKVRDTTGGTVFGLATLSYNDRDQLTSIAYGNGVTTTYTLNALRGWIDRIQTKKDAQTTLLDLTYSRDATGKVNGMNAGRTYVFDNLGRLRYANDTGVYGRFEFTYDKYGNRQTQLWGSYTTSYLYESYGRLQSNTTNGKTTTYEYYASTGKLWKKTESGTIWKFSYDVNDLLTKVEKGSSTVEQYWYDGLGRRVKAIDGSGGSAVTEYTIYSGDLPIYTYNAKSKVSTLHAYANGMHIAKKTSGTTRYYYHLDAVGSTRLVTDKSKAVVFSTDYLPFGKAWSPAGTEDFMFIDSRSTKSSGMVHFGARYYDPNTGRFISPDPVLGSLSTPASMNRWAYCMNDPINRIDKDGQWSLFKSLRSFASSVTSAATSLVGAAVEFYVDTVTAVVDAAVDMVSKAVDAAQKFMDDVKDAALSVTEAVYAGVMSIKDAWNNLDPGLKQWIVMGVSMAVSFIPLVGPLVSCIIDGTFVDMLNAIKNGDWAMLALSCAAFVPGMKGATKGLKFFDKEGSSILKNAAKGKAFENFLAKSKGYIKNNNVIKKVPGVGSWKPDFIMGSKLAEAKAVTGTLSNTRQMNAMCQFAKSNPECQVVLEALEETRLTPQLEKNLLDSGVTLNRNSWIFGG